jgi:hypothetical protein
VRASLVQRFTRLVPAGATGAAHQIRQAWREEAGRAILDAMAHERDALALKWTKQAQTLWRDHQCQLTSNIRWRPEQQFGARACFTRSSQGQPDLAVEINSGTQYAVDDLVGHAMASLSFLKDFESAEEPSHQAVVLSAVTPDRFRTYPSEGEAARDPDAVISALPLDLKRIRAASALSELCLDWIQMHEQAHVILGHLDLLAERQPSQAQLLMDGQTSRTGRDFRSDTYKIMEFQADAYGLELLFLEHLAPAAPTLALWSAPGLVDLGFDVGAVGDKPDVNAFRRVARTLIVAAGLTALLMERSGEGRIDRDDHHPRPSSRLFALILGGASIAEEFLEGLLMIRKRRKLSEHKLEEFLVRLIYECSLDLQLVAATLGIEDARLRYDPDAENPLRTAFVEDLFSMFGAGPLARGAPQPPLTEAGQEFARLQAYSARMSTVLASRHRGGAYLEGRM